jgi:hypothetical protein
MANVKNEYTGDGSTTLFSFTFPYIDPSHVKVFLDSVEQVIETEYTLVNATTVGFVTAPSDGSAVVIRRVTTNDNLQATFFPGSAIRARDLNDNFTQSLYATQESEVTADESSASAAAAEASASAAATSATQAQSDASQAQLDASQAQTDAANALTSATNAQASADQAQTDATQAAADAASAAADAASVANINASLEISGGKLNTLLPINVANGVLLPDEYVAFEEEGAIRYNDSADRLELRTPQGWETAAGGSKIGTTPPSPVSVGDNWFDPDTGRTYVYYDDGDSLQWVEANPSWNGYVQPGSVKPESLSAGGPYWDSSGRLGVGTSSVDRLLHLEHPTDNILARFESGDVNANIEFADNTTTTPPTVGANGDNLRLGTGGTSAIEIDSSQRVGIGTTSPTGLLHISGQDTEVKIQTSAATLADMTNSTSQRVAFQGGNAEIGLFKDSGGDFSYVIGTYQGSTDIPLVFRTGNRTERMRIDSSGNVGIGNSNPAAGASGGSNRILNIASGIASGVSHITFGDSSAVGKIESVNGNGTIAINATTAVTIGTTGSSTERMRIDSSGRLLVGTDTSGLEYANIQVVGGAAGSGSGNIRLSSTDVAPGGDLGGVRFTDYNGQVGAQVLGVRDGGTWTSGNSQPTKLVFSVTDDGQSSPVSRMEIDRGGTTKFNGAITSYLDNTQNIGSASIRWSTIYSATGSINTSDENLKQDIESLESAEIGVAIAIKGLVKKFRFKDAVEVKGEDARIHVGVIAQEVEQAFVDAGLDPRRYALFCENELEDGTKRLGIRYDELLAFVIAAI